MCMYNVYTLSVFFSCDGKIVIQVHLMQFKFNVFWISTSLCCNKQKIQSKHTCLFFSAVRKKQPFTLIASNYNWDQTYSGKYLLHQSDQVP